MSEESKLALLGGMKAVPREDESLFHWPIVTREDEEAVLDVLRRGTMSGTDITKRFEAEYAEWMGLPYALATCNGTAALTAAFWACGVGAGDEVICPSMTYWASAAPALPLGATVNFADIDRETLCIDPSDIESRIGEKTRAIVLVHYAGHPCDMDRILPIARKHGVAVIEDVSHAQGSLYRGKACGTMGDISAMSFMAGKSFALGEGGLIATRERRLYERCVAFGHYERTGAPTRFNPADNQISDPSLQKFSGIALGAVKHRMNQTVSAMGRVQLKQYPARITEIQKALNRFWDCLHDVPGIRPHRIDPSSGSTMGGWYYPHGLYRAEELGGLSCDRFCEAVRAEGVASCFPGANKPLHLHPYFHEADIFRQGRPTSLAFGQRDVRQGRGSLPVSEKIDELCFTVPWFKRDDEAAIRGYAEAFRKVATSCRNLEG
ncbi:MAG: DegT/DnrJ/EryC1/StrS family aminotransferase [Treponemataceae bacterium]